MRKRTIDDRRLVGRAGRPFDIDEGLQQLDAFFQERDPVHKSLKRLIKRLDKAQIPYAVVGGLAVFFHDHRRATNDIDLLMTPAALAEFREKFVPKNYRPVARRARRFVDKVNEVSVDIFVTGGVPGMGHPTPIRFPDPSAVREIIRKMWIINLETLVTLKLAARRHQDFADVVSLIRQHHLDEAFASRLNEAVRRDYIECLDEMRREEEYDILRD